MAKTLIPILLLILTGVLLKKIKFISDDVIDGVKKIASNVFLPFVIFNALVGTSFSKDTIVIVIAAFFILSVCFGLGFVGKKLNKKEYRDYIPFASTLFECGMIGYALTEPLVGKENLYHTATIDIAGVLFCFTIWIVMMQRIVNQDEKQDNKKENVIVSMFKSPTFIAALLGIFFSITGLGKLMLESSVGAIYQNVADMFSAPLTPIILVCLGYGIKITKENILDAFLLVVQRMAIAFVAVAAAWLIFGRFINLTPELKISVLMYYSLPPSLLISVYPRGKKSQEVMACMMSIYILVSLIIFGILLWRVKSV